MKTFLSLRTAALATLTASLFAVCPASFAAPSPATDTADQSLQIAGSIPVKNVGRYVERGTMRIQVSTKLGRPTTVLPDGTWLYDDRAVDESEARGTLVVRFEKNRVRSLSLVTPAVALALQANPHKPAGSDLVATK